MSAALCAAQGVGENANLDAKIRAEMLKEQDDSDTLKRVRGGKIDKDELAKASTRRPPESSGVLLRDVHDLGGVEGPLCHSACWLSVLCVDLVI